MRMMKVEIDMSLHGLPHTRSACLVNCSTFVITAMCGVWCYFASMYGSIAFELDSHIRIANLKFNVCLCWFGCIVLSRAQSLYLIGSFALSNFMHVGLCACVV